jgi:tetratricopeptide (TPR) repeat protein
VPDLGGHRSRFCVSNDDDKRDDERDETTDSGETDAPEASNENESGESDAEESDAEESASASSASTSTSESGSSGASTDASAPAAGKGGRMSAGARLAAAKAAKAVVKAAKKEERKAATAQTEVVEEAPEEAPTAEPAPEDPVKQLEESELGRAALQAGRWWESNQQMGWIALAAAAIAIVGFLGWQYHKETTSAAAGTLLAEALEIASARIEAADEAEPADGADEDEDGEEERTFPTRTARDEAALEAYQAIIAQYPDHPSAGVARLGAARTLLALGRNDEALEMYQQAFDRNGGRSGTIAWQALEGVGFAQEAAGQPDEARATYERLGGLDDHAYEQVANYHLARLMLARGERDEARTALRELVDALRAETVEDSSEPRFPYLLSQAEVRLRELDPSSATSAGPQLLGPGGGEPGAGGTGDIDPAQLQELIRQFQAQQQQGAGGGEGGGE